MKLANPLIIFWFAAFAGIYQLFGMPGSVIKLAIFVMILVFSPFIYSLLRIKKTYSLKELFDLAFLFVLPLFLVLFQDNFSSRLSVFQSIVPVFIVYTFSIFINAHPIRDIRKLLTTFLSIQFFASIIKYVIAGTQEGGGIGTISVQAGSLSTFIVVLFLSVALSERRVRYKLLFLLQALIFAYINEKRLGIMLIAFTGVIISYQLKDKFKANSRIFYIIFGFLLSLFLGVSLLNVNPTILDGMELFEFGNRVFYYLFQERSDGIPIGRLAGIKWTFSQVSLETLIKGLDPLMFFSSSLTDVNTIDENIFKPSGFLIVFSRTGLLGLISYAWLFASLSENISMSKILFIYVLFDFLIYSDSIMVSYLYPIVISLYFHASFSKSIQSNFSSCGDGTS